MGGFSQNLENR